MDDLRVATNVAYTALNYLKDDKINLLDGQVPKDISTKEKGLASQPLSLTSVHS